MRVLLIRHAKAVPRGTPGIPDDERPLTPEGEESFLAAARGLARLVDRPDAVFSSPLPRAWRTGEIAAEAWGKVRLRKTEALVGGSFEEVTGLCATVASDGTVALVGHEPHLSGLLAQFLGARRGEALTFRKGGAALVEFPGVPPQDGALVWFLPPKILRRLADR